MIHLCNPEGPACPFHTTVPPLPLQTLLDSDRALMRNSLPLNDIHDDPRLGQRGVQLGAEFAFYGCGSSWYGHTHGKGGGWMIKALFTMILLSNEYAARLVERFQRLRA
jgi:hypothetical protein